MKIPHVSKQKLAHAARIIGITPKVLAARLYPPPKPEAPPEILRIGQAAAMLGVSVTSLIVWEKQGRIACLYRLPGQGRRFSRQAVEAFRTVRLRVPRGGTQKPPHVPPKTLPTAFRSDVGPITSSRTVCNAVSTPARPRGKLVPRRAKHAK
jgi:hypothetical protein